MDTKKFVASVIKEIAECADSAAMKRSFRLAAGSVATVQHTSIRKAMKWLKTQFEAVERFEQRRQNAAAQLGKHDVRCAAIYGAIDASVAAGVAAHCIRAAKGGK